MMEWKCKPECRNCKHWNGCEVGGENECAREDDWRLWEMKSPGSTCQNFKPDGHRFCEICGAAAVEGENCTMVCAENDAHFCSQWDMIYIDCDAQ